MPELPERYDRHVRLPEVGGEGQQRLLSATAVLVGAGGLGCPVAIYLAVAGVGRLRLVEPERVEPSNLNRQILYGPADVGRLKSEVAAERLRALNPDCRVETLCTRLTADRVAEVFADADVVLDCSDNFPTRLVVADACWQTGRPLVSASALGWLGNLLSVLPAEGSPCYRCLVPEAPPPEEAPTAAEVGVLGPVVGVMGTSQALEAVRVLAGVGETFAHRLGAYDGRTGTWRILNRQRDPACRVCGSAV